MRLLSYILSFIVTSIFCGTLSAKSTPPLFLEEIFTEAKLTPGANGLLRLRLQLKPEHKAYVDQFELKATNIEELKHTQIQVFPFTPLLDPHTQKMRNVVSGEFSLETVIEISEKNKSLPKKLNLELKYQACTLKYCYTPKTLKFELPPT